MAVKINQTKLNCHLQRPILLRKFFLIGQKIMTSLHCAVVQYARDHCSLLLHFKRPWGFHDLGSLNRTDLRNSRQFCQTFIQATYNKIAYFWNGKNRFWAIEVLFYFLIYSKEFMIYLFLFGQVSSTYELQHCCTTISVWLDIIVNSWHLNSSYRDFLE